MVEQTITAGCFLFLAIAAMTAVFSRRFKDSFLQRVGLALVSIFGLGAAVIFWKADPPTTIVGYAIGQALFTLGSILKR